ncbi:5057_t:CDS:2, partial [Entrophospora sp. SA101]
SEKTENNFDSRFQQIEDKLVEVKCDNINTYFVIMLPESNDNEDILAESFNFGP